jgi:hypothetical protein
MQALPVMFHDKTFAYTQVEREGDIAIYRQTHKAGAVDRYEVVRIRVEKEHVWPNGDISPERETYPGSNAWGRYGWTFFTLDAAQAHAAQWREPAP